MTPSHYSTLGDDELLELTLEDPDAFGVFYDRFEEEVLAFFMRATRRPDVAADLTAEVFAAALSSARLFRAELGSARAMAVRDRQTRARRHMAARPRRGSRAAPSRARADDA